MILDFSEPKRNIDLNNPIYINSALYNKLKKQPQVFKNICSAFENFIDYLKDDQVTIDYTYLWDIICSPQPKLFKDGINMVIMDIPNKDTTNNISIICPTNHYAAQFYDAKKPTLLLIKQENYFEPIYLYREGPIIKGPKLSIEKLFKERDVNLSPAIRSLFVNIVKPFYQRQCIPFASMPNKYKMKTPLTFEVLMRELKEIGYKGNLQVLNYQGKVIGVIAKSLVTNVAEPEGEIVGASTGFVPCYPSSMNKNMAYEYMTESKLWSNYANTVSFLMTLYARAKGKIPCRPAFKVVEDEVVVGILTETDQFIQLKQPLPVSEVNDAIPELRDTNYIIAENNMTNAYAQGEKDQERIDYIGKIKMETKLYNVFRNTTRMLLNDYANLKLREDIEETVNAPYIIYQGKLEQASRLLVALMNKYVIFVDGYDYKLVKEATTCLNKEKDKCLADSPLCTTDQSSQVCQMVLPKKNLVTGANNERNYYLKMADELIRYSRIKSFLFEPQVYLSFRPLEYQLRDDEIILMQSLITQEYFRSLVPAQVNPYRRF